MIPVLGSRAMRAADAEAIRGGTASEVLMENAAVAIARVVGRAYPEAKRVVVVCGPGNNGGDGLAAARHLAFAGVAASVFTLKDPEGYRGDAAVNAARARAVGLSLRALSEPSGFSDLRRELHEGDVVVDALFGTGLTRALDGAARRAVAAVNAAGRPIVSADLPSGLSADLGAPIGPAVRAARTVALGAPKPCHVLAPASGLCGEVLVADIGIPRASLSKRATRVWLAEAADVRALLPPRPLDSNKSNFGRLALLAGSRGKAGAAALAARGALRGGAGLVTVFCAEAVAAAVVAVLPEAMTERLPESVGAMSASGANAAVAALRAFDAAVIGPGLSSAAGTFAFVEAVVAKTRLPLVVDADGLNALAGRPAFFARHRGPVVLTPHPGEAGRLLGISTAAVQKDRLGAARALARRSRAVCVLKGFRTLIASPSGEVVVNPTGTPLLSTAGTGDVLAGLLGAILAGGLSARDAAVAAVWLHGAAAESLTDRLGDSGMLAREAADAIPGARRRLRDFSGRP